MDTYTMTIGLEVHAELSTKSKMFCGCANMPISENFEKFPNVNICPVCMGHPGTLPVINKEAVKKVLLVGTAVGGKIADLTEWGYHSWSWLRNQVCIRPRKPHILPKSFSSFSNTLMFRMPIWKRARCELRQTLV